MGKIMTSFRNMMGFEDEDIYDDYEVEEMEGEEIVEPREAYSVLSRRKEAREHNKVVSLRGTGTKVHILKPATFDEAPQICESLKANMIVVVNTTSLEARTAQRLLDFIAGATYALGGELEEVENGVYVLTPSIVQVTRDTKEENTFKGFLNWK